MTNKTAKPYNVKTLTMGGAIAALYAEHAGLVSFLGIDEYFPPRAVAVSSLPADGGEEGRTFASYLYESLRAVFGGS